MARLDPIWDSGSFLLGIEREQKILSLVYSGELYQNNEYRGVVRRVDFSSTGEVSRRWEYRFDRDHFLSQRYGRLGELILLPGEPHGVAAIDIKSGERRWELGHPSKLHQKPHVTSEGDALIFLFEDQTWISVSLQDGAVRDNGRVANDSQARELFRKKRLLLPEMSEELFCRKTKISLSGDSLSVSKDSPEDDTPVFDVPGPKEGEYPLEEWSCDDYLGVVDGKLTVWMERRWGDLLHMALGIFALPTLEPLRLLQLGEGPWSADCDAALVVDGLLFLKAERKDGDRSVYCGFVIDVKAEHTIALLAEERNSLFFYPQNQAYWKGQL